MLINMKNVCVILLISICVSLVVCDLCDTGYVPGFILQKKRNCDGNIIRWFRTCTERECAAFCLMEPNCHAFVINFEQRDKVCYLKSQCEKVEKAEYLSIYQSINVPNFIHQDNVECSGKDLSVSESTSPLECSQLCMENKNCQGFVFDTNYKKFQCLLKSICTEVKESIGKFTYKPENVQQFTSSVNKECIGDDINEFVVYTPAECASFCNTINTICQAFLIRPFNLQFKCILKSKCNQKIYRQESYGYISYTRDLNVVTKFGDLIFKDEFDTFDLDRWEHEITMGGGGNWEFQLYHNNRSNSYVRNGTLFIKPTLVSDRLGEPFLYGGYLDMWGSDPASECTGNAFYGCARQGNANQYINPIQSARIRTAKSFSFTYGRVEVRAKMPKGDWLWPAIWMLPRLNEYGQWPSSGEIDLFESRGNLNLQDESGNQRGNTYGGPALNWGPFVAANKFTLTHGEKYANYTSDFHVFATEWMPSGIRMLIDEVEIFSAPGAVSFWEFGRFQTDYPNIDNPWKSGTKMAPFDKDFYLILNVAVGGTNGYFPDSWTNVAYSKPWRDDSQTAFKEFWQAKNNWYETWNPRQNNGEDAALQVDYVRVYSLPTERL